MNLHNFYHVFTIFIIFHFSIIFMILHDFQYFLSFFIICHYFHHGRCSSIFRASSVIFIIFRIVIIFHHLSSFLDNFPFFIMSYHFDHFLSYSLFLIICIVFQIFFLSFSRFCIMSHHSLILILISFSSRFHFFRSAISIFHQRRRKY